jgi:hypothetical protein
MACLFTITGAMCGFVVGMFLRSLVTNLVLIPIFSLLPPSSQNDEYTPIIKVLGQLISLTAAVVGGGVGYYHGTKKAIERQTNHQRKIGRTSKRSCASGGNSGGDDSDNHSGNQSNNNGDYHGNGGGDNGSANGHDGGPDVTNVTAPLRPRSQSISFPCVNIEAGKSNQHYRRKGTCSASRVLKPRR